MNVKKTCLASIQMPYVVTHLQRGGEDYYLCAGEKRPSESVICRRRDLRTVQFSDGPGGCMSLVPFGDKLFAIQCFFPIFDSAGAKIVRYDIPEDPLELSAQAEDFLALPFAHRIEIVHDGEEHYLVAASLCGSKRFTEDWSDPGAVYVMRLDERGNAQGPLKKLMGNLTRNHGMFARGDRVWFSSDQGVFSWSSRQGETVQQVLDRRVSDMFVADIDNDGEDELLTIEPFHGNLLTVNKFDHGRQAWEMLASHPMEFGHVVAFGEFGGKNHILGSDRAGKKELYLLDYHANTHSLERRVIDSGVGATQARFVGGELICADHACDEFCLYQLARD